MYSGGWRGFRCCCLCCCCGFGRLLFFVLGPDLGFDYFDFFWGVVTWLGWALGFRVVGDFADHVCFFQAELDAMGVFYGDVEGAQN